MQINNFLCIKFVKVVYERTVYEDTIFASDNLWINTILFICISNFS
jgi:hypothetical protein